MTPPTNESGHGLPELPDTEFCADHEGTERLYTAAQVQQYAIDYAAALALSRGVPADMVLVPKYPTAKITLAMHDAYKTGRSMVEAYDAMIKAAPAAAGAQGEEGCGACGDGCKDRAGCELAEQSPPIPQPAAADGGVRERARELLARELREDMRPGAAEQAESGELDHDPAMRAISAALSSHRQAGDHLSKFRELAERWRVMSDPYHGKCADELLSLIDEVPK